MDKKIREIVRVQGVIFPCRFNSDSKPIEFTLHSPDGHIYFLNSDHLVTKMRKLQYQLVMIRGEVRTKDNETFINVKNLSCIERNDHPVHPMATSLFEQDLKVFAAS